MTNGAGYANSPYSAMNRGTGKTTVERFDTTNGGETILTVFNKNNRGHFKPRRLVSFERSGMITFPTIVCEELDLKQGQKLSFACISDNNTERFLLLLNDPEGIPLSNVQNGLALFHARFASEIINHSKREDSEFDWRILKVAISTSIIKYNGYDCLLISPEDNRFDR